MSTSKKKDLSALKVDLRAVLMSDVNGVGLSQLGRVFEDLCQYKLIPAEYGFTSMLNLIESLPDTARFENLLVLQVSLSLSLSLFLYLLLSSGVYMNN